MLNVIRRRDSSKVWKEGMIDLSYTHLKGADLKGKRSRSRIRKKERYASSNLTKLNFEGSNLEGADLMGANLSNTSFAKASLDSAVLLAANLTNTDFTDASVKDAKFSDYISISSWGINVDKESSVNKLSNSS